MSFKKTSDGKVFFQGANANDAFEDNQDLPIGNRAMGAETQLQVLALLRSLNEKLQATQNQYERFDTRLESFRSVIEELEEKTKGQKDKLADLDKKIVDIFGDTRKELEKTRQALFQFQGAGERRAYRSLSTPDISENILSQSHAYVAPEITAPFQKSRFSFTGIYAAILSVFVVGGIVALWTMGGFSPAVHNAQPQVSAPVEVDLSNQEQLNRMMETDPGAVAAKLNTLEPGAINTQYDVHGLIQPDPALPASFKDAEEKAFSGSIEDQHNLAALYASPKGKVGQDYARASFWFRQAAERGMANAQYNLGVMYHQGLGVEKDLKQAAGWYKAAAAQQHAEAEYNLGIAYIEGVGVEYDPVKAVENFQKAADQGVVEAAYNLGLIYENALLGRADPSKALSWYKRAADQGSPEATAALEQLARTLNIDIQDIDRVVSQSNKT